MNRLTIHSIFSPRISNVAIRKRGKIFKNKSLSAKKAELMLKTSPVRTLRNRVIPLRQTARNKAKQKKVFASTPLTKTVPFAPTPMSDASMASAIMSDMSFDQTNMTQPSKTTKSKAKRGLTDEFGSSTINQTTLNGSIDMEPIEEETDFSSNQASMSNAHISSVLLGPSMADKSKFTSHLTTSPNSHKYDDTKDTSDISEISDSSETLSNKSLTHSKEHSADQMDTNKLQESTNCLHITSDKEDHETESTSILLPEVPMAKHTQLPNQCVGPRTKRNIGFNDSISIHEVSRHTNNLTTNRHTLPSIRDLVANRIPVKGGKWRRTVYQFKRDLAESKQINCKI